MKKGTPVQVALADLCSTMQYMEDRGELTGQFGGYVGVSRILTTVRYTDLMQKGVDFFDVECDGRLIRVSAVDMGTAPPCCQDCDGPHRTEDCPEEYEEDDDL